MQSITEIFEDGLLKPSHPLDLSPHPEVRPTIEVLSPPRLTVGGLYAFLRSLPSLGDDAKAFAQDLRDVLESFPEEADLWDR
jgi:hypothetical protein